MGIKFVKEGNVCDRCKKPDTEVGTITHYTEFNQNSLLCSKCIEEIKEVHTRKCSNCKKPVGVTELSTYNQKNDLCYDCIKKMDKSQKVKLKTKNFVIDNWKFWIATSIGIISIIVIFIIK